MPWPYAGQQVLVRERQGREVIVLAPDGTPVAAHVRQPSGSPPVLQPAHYEGLRRRHQAAFAGLAREFQTRYGPAGVTEAFLQGLRTHHGHHPDVPLRQALDLLSAVPGTVAQAVLADAVEFQRYTPQFLAERLRQRTRTAVRATPFAPEPAPVPAPPASRPCLEIDRPLAHYGRALDPAGLPPAAKGS